MTENDDVRRIDTKRCPNCGKPSAVQFRPFCSGRCKDVDLAHWLSGAYAIPGSNLDRDGTREANPEKPEELQ